MTETYLKRMVIIGTSCSGKTTLAQTLSQVLNMSHIELDAIHWLPNWQSRPLAELRPLVQETVAAKQWVLDGNYSKVRDIVWHRPTTVIWLNYPFDLVLWLALYRTTKRVLSQEELFGGNREGFRQSFLSKDSIIWWVITTYARRRREYPQLFKQPEYAHLNIIEFRTPTETKRFVAHLRTQKAQLA